MGGANLAKLVEQLWLNELLIWSSLQGNFFSDHDYRFDRLLHKRWDISPNLRSPALVCIHYPYTNIIGSEA